MFCGGCDGAGLVVIPTEWGTETKTCPLCDGQGAFVELPRSDVARRINALIDSPALDGITEPLSKDGV